nr:Ni/Fe-hydrogenase cytochrome b subunit [candidate division Zixibacteria bacterium]
MNRVQITKTILWIIVGLASAVGITRFLFGLGAATNLTDATPWGLWIGFDVMSGVALAAGGFVITALFYIMRREEFHNFVKPAVLTAFLGYIAVVVGLLFDLGLPWNIWHMIIFWNPHSPLFEVGWCVMMYTTVLLLEFSPVPLEEQSRYAKIRSFLMKLRFPLVMLGIMLSTLHQSSLGSLFLIMPYKLYPLWYTNILPILFFISAVALGFMMIIFESLTTHWVYRKDSDTARTAKLGGIAVWVLGIYLVVRMIDIIANGKFGLIFTSSRESVLFLAEILISTIIPMVIFSVRRLQYNRNWQWIGATMVVFGMIFNRINIGGLTMIRATGDTYFPSWMEFAISFGVVSAAALAFMFAIEKFHVWEKKPKDPRTDPFALPTFDRASGVWLGSPSIAARTRYSLAFIFSFAIGFAMIPDNKIHSEGMDEVPVTSARGGDTLYIDGNLNNYGVSFDHTRHAEEARSGRGCVTCHHMNIPFDKNSGCWKCHKEMFTRADIFDHTWHSSPSGANIACDKCHPAGQLRTTATVKQCADCHKDLVAPNSTITFDNYLAVSYVDAMHDLCIPCHQQAAAAHPEKPMLAQCGGCHGQVPPENRIELLRNEAVKPGINPVVLPQMKVQ